MLLRRWHRWFALPSALFLMFISATGVLLHLDMIRVGQTPPGHAAPPAAKVQPIPSDAALRTMIVSLAQAVRAEPGTVAQSLQIDLSGKQVTLVATAGNAPGAPQIRLDARTGARIAMPAPPADYHFILQDLHAGYFAGWTGRIVSILCGMSLFVLALTGLQLWWSMARRKKQIFWK